jgi:tRNA pseudouridine55 synthase
VIDGLALVDKEAGWTSHDVVARCRRIFGQRRVGHSGTLDPGATGLLLVGLGRATRLLRFLTALPKSYEGEVVLGVATSTLDDAGEQTGSWDMSGVELDAVRAAAAALVGPILQLPPMVSAVQVGGRRLHELARKGIEVERVARPVVVHRLEVSPGAGPAVFRISVTCSSGTYVRVLAADLGAALGGGAHLRRLRRTGIGSFSVDEARTLDALADATGEGRPPVLSAADAMRDYARVAIDGDAAAEVAHGRPLPRDRLALDGDGPWGLLDASGTLLAVYESGPSGRAVAAVVLAAG